MSARAQFGCLFLLLALLPGRIEAAESKIERLRLSRDVFTLDDVQLSCDLAPRIQAGAGDATSRGTQLEAQYRFRVLDDDSNCRWDSGWIHALVSRRRPLRTSPVPVNCRPDSASTAELTEIRIEVMAEVSARACQPVQWHFYRWADGRFRSRPEPTIWPDHRAEAAAAWSEVTVRPTGVTITGSSTPALTLGTPVAPRLVLPTTRVSWGQIKAGYR
jgi:hypothetical protein